MRLVGKWMFCVYLKSYPHLYGFLQCVLKSLYNISFGSWLLIIWRKPYSLSRSMHTYANIEYQSYSFLLCGWLTWLMHMTQFRKGLPQSTGRARVSPLWACGGCLMGDYSEHLAICPDPLSLLYLSVSIHGQNYRSCLLFDGLSSAPGSSWELPCQWPEYRIMKTRSLPLGWDQLWV